MEEFFSNLSTVFHLFPQVVPTDVIYLLKALAFGIGILCKFLDVDDMVSSDWNNYII